MKMGECWTVDDEGFWCSYCIVAASV